MISFDNWLSQIFGYCEFLVDSNGVKKSWILGDYSDTSITGFDELYEQIFDDLASDEMENTLDINISDAAARKSLSDFLAAVRSIDESIQKNSELKNNKNLLCSLEWAMLIESANNVLCKDYLRDKALKYF